MCSVTHTLCVFSLVSQGNAAYVILLSLSIVLSCADYKPIRQKGKISMTNNFLKISWKSVAGQMRVISVNVLHWGRGCGMSLTAVVSKLVTTDLSRALAGWCVGTRSNATHAQPLAKTQRKGPNQDIGMSWAWDDGPFGVPSVPKGRGKMETTEEKPGNDPSGQLVGYHGRG